MKKSYPPMSCSFVALPFVLSVCICSAASTCPLLQASRAADSDKTGDHIVVLKDETTHERFEEIKSKLESMTEDEKVHGSVERLVKAFTVKLSDRALSDVRSIPDVEYVEEETMAHSTQFEIIPPPVGPIPVPESAIWHVDRLDQYYLPLDNSYQPNGTGDGVDIYILDTGVYYDHEEFEGRAEYGGYDPTDIDTNQQFRGSDCTGHGTHVASLAAGKKYGTAKKARIYSIRVLECSGWGRWFTIIDGLEYCSRIIPERGRPALVSMSLGGWYSRTFEKAIKRLHTQNITVVASAGNYFDDACEFSPAGSPSVITVAGSARDDEIYYATNFGPCVDIFAPGSQIEAADSRCESCSRYMSGTSMAAPKVSGIAAIHLEKDPTLTPDQMKTKLISTATPDVLDFSYLPYDDQLSTPNRLLYIGYSVSIDCEKPTNITNGNVSVTGLTPGSVATYSCASGYALKGAQNRTCNFLGNWSQEPKCAKTCPALPWNIPNGELTGEYDEPVENSTVRYSCYYGHSLVGDRVRTCQANGTWSGEEPTCVKKSTCRQLSYDILRGYVYGDIYPPIEGSTAFYRCYDGYSLVGDYVRICQSNGTWSGKKPTCVRKMTCPELTWDVPYGYLSGNYFYEAVEASIVYHRCYSGYSLLGDDARICQANGTWSGEEPKCVRIRYTCPRLPSYIPYGEVGGNYYRSVKGSTVHYYCNYGYSLLGDRVRICQANGTWSGEEPTCVRTLKCPRLTWNVTNGYLSGGYYQPVEGSIAYYRCYHRYSILGDDFSICQANGTWSGEQPICVSASTCPELKWNITNGDLRGDYYGTVEGSIAYYYCYYGHFLLGGHVRICQANRTWTGEQPICIAQCPELSLITNGNITGHLGNRTVGTIVNYTCIDGYALVGRQHRICQSNQTWSGLKPSCVLVPPAPKIQAQCSIVVWYSPKVLNYDNNITGYDVRLYVRSPQQNLTRRVGSNRTFYIISDEDNLGNSTEKYVQVRAVSIYEIAGKWSEGISLGCDRPAVKNVTMAPETPSVYFELNRKIYYNNSVIVISSIGEAERALYCKTDKKGCCKTIPNRFGEFYYPNGTRVSIESYGDGFYRNRGEQFIRLNRREETISPIGKYRCEMPDASGEMKNIYTDLI